MAGDDFNLWWKIDDKDDGVIKMWMAIISMWLIKKQGKNGFGCLKLH